MGHIKSGLLFLAPYPNEENIRDGMVSRVEAIDMLVRDKNRIYLNISFRRNWKKMISDLQGVRVYNLNIFLHFMTILKVFRSSKLIYIHSLHSVKHVIMLFPILHPEKIILDAHGVVPEEEKYFRNLKLLVAYYQFVERVVFYYANHIVCVTSSMIRYFRKKYPNYKGDYHLYRILPSVLRDEDVAEKLVPDEKIRVLYSGGIAPWQKIDLILEMIEKYQSSNIQYMILTGRPDYFRFEINKYQINPDNLVIDSVDPSELYKYYREADYGFILRDDNPVNNVANPTKLIEYLYYGMIPIMLSKNIGDYREMDIDYLPLDQFSESIPKPLRKSKKNMQVARMMISQNNASDLLQLFESISC